MPQFIRGKLRFTYRQTGSIVSMADVVERFSCHPPPAGTREGANPILQIPSLHSADHLQDAEAGRIIEFTAGQGNPGDMPTIISDIASNFRFRSLTVDLADIPRDWRRPLPCYDTIISFVVESIIVRVDVVANQDVSVGGVSWPVGDVVASLQYIVPDRYRFQRQKTHNPECCPVAEDGVQPPPQSENDDWSDHNFVSLAPEPEIEEIIVTGRRRRSSLDDRPVPITPITPEDLMDLDDIPPRESGYSPRDLMDPWWLDVVPRFKPLPMGPSEEPGSEKHFKLDLSPYWLFGKIRYWF